MKEKRFLSALLAVLMVVAGQASAMPPQAANPPTQPSPSASPDRTAGSSYGPGPAMAPGVVLVGLREDVAIRVEGQRVQTTDADLEDTLADVGVWSVEPVFPEGRGLRASIGDEGDLPLSGIQRLHLAPDADILQVVGVLKAQPAIVYAEPDYLAHTITIPDDPLYSQQWGLAQIEAPAAWDVVTGVSDVAIAVVDSGLDTSHVDLAGQVWVNPGEIPGNSLDDDNNGYADDVHGWNLVDGNADLTDNTGHGTEVAGIIAAATDNDEGIAGVCWHCRLMVVKVTQPGGVANYSDIAAGVVYAAQKGAEVINLSLGGYSDSSTLRAAIEAAAQTAVVVGGAGNDDRSSHFYPAAYDDVLAVAGTAEDDSKVSSSNYGLWVDVSAPGEGITTTFDGGGYGATSGTSMAAPFVAGLAGLLSSLHPGWSPDLMRAQIVHTVDDVDGVNPGYEGWLGSGRIDAGAAVSTTPVPLLSVQSYAVNDQPGDPAPGDTFDLVVTLHNAWGPASGLSGTLSTGDAYATVDDSSGAFSDIATYGSGDNSSDPFQVTLSSATPYGHAVPFTLDLSDDGSLNTSLAFTLTVRSAVEHIPGGTIISADTTWAADKIYVLDGNVIVGENVTLTIEPGTLIKVIEGSWLRIDGTLLASGTTDLPIRFTTATQTTTGPQQWAGLRFSDKSEAAVVQGGAYVSGSILRHAHFEYATKAVAVNNRAPYIANCAFRFSGWGVSNDGTARIAVVDSLFEDNAAGIMIWSGYLYLVGNTFAHNGWGTDVRGSPIAVYAHENRFVDNTYVGAVLGGEVSFEHNLLGNNGEAGARLSVSSSSHTEYKPDVAYNSQHDEYLVAWQDYNYASDSYDIVARRVVTDGTVIDAKIDVTTTGSNEYGVQLAYNPLQDQYLAVYEDGDQDDVFARLLGGDGQPQGDPIPICVALGSQATARVLYVPTTDRYLVTWLDERNGTPAQIYGRLLGSDGTPVGDELLLAEPAGLPPAMAYGPDVDRVLLAWTYGGLQGQWLTITETGVLAGDPFEISSTSGSSGPAVAYSPGHQQFMVAWPQLAGIDVAFPPTGTISGTIPVTTVVTIAGVTAPAASYNPVADEYLLVWSQDDTNVYAQRVTTDGLPAGGSFAVSVGSSHRFDPRVATAAPNGEALVVWSDYRDYRNRIFGQRASASGALLDNPLTPQVETDPTVNFRIEAMHNLRYNTFINNGANAQYESPCGQQLGGTDADWTLAGPNNYLLNTDYDFCLAGPRDVETGGSYWGDTLPGQIPTRIYDCNDTEFGCPDPDLGQVGYQPVASDPIVEAPAFVQAATITPPLVGIEQATFDVSFSRPMDPSTDPTLWFLTWSQRDTSNSDLPDDRVWDILVDTDQSLWLATEAGGVAHLHDETWTVYNSANSGLPSNKVLAVALDQDGSKWFATGGGVAHFDGASWTVYNSWNSPLPPSEIRAVAVDHEGIKWFGTGEGVARFDGTTWTIYNTSNSGLPGNSVLTITIDSQGSKWFGTSNDGAARFDGQEWVVYDITDSGMYDHTVESIAVEDNGTLWFGTHEGVASFDGATWQAYYLPGQDVRAIAIDQHGNKWFGSEGGIALFDGTKWTYYDSSNTGLSNVEITAIALESDTTMWFGTYGGLGMLFSTERAHITDNAQWLDDNHWQATYDMTSLVPRDTYTLHIGGAKGTDGIEIAADRRFAFAVDYAGEITDKTAPPAPWAWAHGIDGDPTSVEAVWWASDPESIITAYRYAIGTTAGAMDIVNWTPTGLDTSLSRSGLGLVDGREYWLSVQARNEGGLWSASRPARFVAGHDAPKIFLPLVLRSQ